LSNRGKSEITLAPAKWGRVLALPEPPGPAVQFHRESRWSRIPGKWHLKVAAAHEKPAKVTAAGTWKAGQGQGCGARQVNEDRGTGETPQALGSKA